MMTRTRPASVDASTISTRRGKLKTVRLTCHCGVSLTYCADEDTFRKERNWVCYRCGGKYVLNDR